MIAARWPRHLRRHSGVAAAENPRETRFGPFRINIAPGHIGTVPIQTPLRNITVNVVQSPGIGRPLADWMWIGILSFICPSESRDIAHIVSKPPSRCSSCAASTFPLGFRWQIATGPFAEDPRFPPRYTGDGDVS